MSSNWNDYDQYKPLSDEDMWHALVTVAIASDRVEAYLVYCSMIKAHYPTERIEKMRNFLQDLSAWAKHFGTPLPDGRRKKPQHTQEVQ